MRRSHGIVVGLALLGGSLFLHQLFSDPAPAAPGNESPQRGATVRGGTARAPGGAGAVHGSTPLDAGVLAARALRVSSSDEANGLPTFVWAARPERTSAPSADSSREAVIDAARAHVAEVADVYALDVEDVLTAPIRSAHVGRAGGRIVALGAAVDGVDVFRRELRVMMDESNELVGLSGNLPTSEELAGARGRVHALSAADAVERAVASVLGDVAAGVRASSTGQSSRYERFALATSRGERGDARAKPIFSDSSRGLVPAYYVEVDAGSIGGEPAYVAVVIDAEDGAALFENELSAAAEFSYRVFVDSTPPYRPWDSSRGTYATPHPTGAAEDFLPSYAIPPLVTLQAVPFSRSSTDAWLSDGATTSSGNNVDAYADLGGANGYDAGDIRPTVTAPGVFDRTMWFGVAPDANAEQIAASATNLFVTTNFLHDWFYDAGFDEAAGNAQLDNYGRGGLDGDRLLAESQDHERPNDARVTVPADGASPRLELGLYDDLSWGIDGAVDNSLVAHEWAHVMTRRLVGDGNGFTNAQGRAIDEGSADFVALLVIVRAEDINVVSNPNWSGVYAVGNEVARGRSSAAAFFGLRRFGYSADLAKNALGFRHIERGTDLPGTTPIAPGASSLTNHEPHNAGEVWASMLWDCYVSLLRAHPFQEAQDRMKTYFVNGLKMTPVDPTFVEARDAILAAAMANDPADQIRFSIAFARRGLGSGAVAPVRFSGDLIGVVESYEASTHSVAVSYRIDDALDTCDGDGILDAGETGSLHVTVENIGIRTIAPDSLIVSAAPSGTSGVEVQFPHWTSLPVQELSPGARFTGTFPIRLASSDGSGLSPELSFALGWNGVYTNQASPRVHYDLGPSTLDDFASSDLQWSVFPTSGTRAPALRASQLGEGQALHVPAPGFAGESVVTSPPIQVAPSGSFSLGFVLRYSFAGDAPPYTDGVVLEASVDGGRWLDVESDLGVDLDYDGVLEGGGENPLAGRAAFVGYGAASRELDFGQTLAGRTVRFRFRVGTDASGGTYGLELDDVEVTNAAVPPFAGTAEETSDGSVCNQKPVARASTFAAQVNELVFTPPSTVTRTVVSLDGSASSDADGEPLTYAWTQISGPPVTLSNADSPSATFVANVSANASFLFALTVSDGNESATDTVEVHVFDVPVPPIAAISGPVSITERAGDVTLDGGDSSSVVGGGLTYAWTQTAGPSVSFTNGGDSITFTPPEVSVDTVFSFALVVSDGEQSSAPAAFDVTVLEEDRGPTVSVPPTVNVASSALASATATGTDPDGTVVTYAWTQTSGPMVTLIGAATATVSFVAPSVDDETTITLVVVASSGGESSSPTTVAFIVAERSIPDSPPVLAPIAASSVVEGETATVTSSATDVDGDAITYAWTQVSGPTVTLVNAATATVSFEAPSVDAPAIIELMVVATARSASDAAVVTVVVAPVASSDGGCSAAGGASDGSAAWVLAIGLALVARMRRRRA